MVDGKSLWGKRARRQVEDFAEGTAQMKEAYGSPHQAVNSSRQETEEKEKNKEFGGSQLVGTPT